MPNVILANKKSTHLDHSYLKYALVFTIKFSEKYT